MERVGRMDRMERTEDLERSPAREGCEERPSENVGERELGRHVKAALGGKNLWGPSRALLRIHWATVQVRSRRGSTGIVPPSL